MMFMRALAKSELAELKALGGSAPTLIVRFYAIAGAPLDEDQEGEVDPRDFKIPASQWRDICASIKGLGGQLAWMNCGPSAIE